VEFRPRACQPLSGAVSTSVGLAMLLLGLGPWCPWRPVRVVTQHNLHSQACLTAPGTMSEARRDSTSSLQRKKPPWLKLDIPAAVPPAAEEPSFLQVGSGQ
jgi:hypothetical protein